MTEEKTPVPETRVFTARRLTGREDESAVERLYMRSSFWTEYQTMRKVSRGDERVGLFLPKGILVASATFGIAKNQSDLCTQLSTKVGIQDDNFPVLTMERTCALPALNGFDVLRLLALQIAVDLNVRGRPIGAMIGIEEEPAALRAMERGYQILWTEEEHRAVALLPQARFQQSIKELQQLLRGPSPIYRWEDSRLPFKRYMSSAKKSI